MRWNWVGVATVLCLGAVGLASTALAAEFDQTRPVAGLRQNLPQIYALVGARIVVAPGRVIELGNLVVRDGVIEAVGQDVVVPSEATRWDVSGKFIYPGLIDAYSETDVEGVDAHQAAGYWSEHVQPQRSVAVDLCGQCRSKSVVPQPGDHRAVGARPATASSRGRVRF